LMQAAFLTSFADTLPVKNNSSRSWIICKNGTTYAARLNFLSHSPLFLQRFQFSIQANPWRSDKSTPCESKQSFYWLKTPFDARLNKLHFPLKRFKWTSKGDATFRIEKARQTKSALSIGYIWLKKPLRPSQFGCARQKSSMARS
jgi:hypothetical protein